ncbi:hypothetical protein TNCT_509011 [Trichonephila clavata]|uniref:Uncharacterized protein n=1 Tax=Trichonephila clavata TaxID=2740835 RepID=A0A8X6KFP7_TRICU|nr:hypothetical protein TNCT_509011 [Trichonephila clavata]
MQVYDSRYPDRKIPKHQMFARKYCILCEQDSPCNNMHDTRRRRLTWTVNVKERVLQSFEDNPNTSTLVIAQQLGVCQSCG